MNTVGLLLAAGGLLTVLGPWPVWKQLATLDPTMVRLYLMQLAAQKGDLLVALLTVGLGLLVFLFGRHFKAGWRSHTQSIVIGLFAVAVSLLAFEVVVLRTLHFTQAEQESVMRLRFDLRLRSRVDVPGGAGVVDCVAMAGRAGRGPAGASGCRVIPRLDS